MLLPVFALLWSCLSLLFVCVSGNDGCDAFSISTTFPGGKFSDLFVLEGKPEDVVPASDGQGLVLQLTTQNVASTVIKSKSVWAPGTMFSITMATSGRPGVMSDVMVWPTEGLGHGEIDLEFLGGASRSNLISCPIWKPGPDQASSAINFAKASFKDHENIGWPTDEEGPTMSFGSSSPVLGVPNGVQIINYDNTKPNDYQLSYQSKEISWTVNKAKFAGFAIGSDPSQWPGTPPMQMNIGIWANTNLGWMCKPDGCYTANAADPPQFRLLSVSISGCVVTKDITKVSGPNSRDASQSASLPSGHSVSSTSSSPTSSAASIQIVEISSNATSTIVSTVYPTLKATGLSPDLSTDQDGNWLLYSTIYASAASASSTPTSKPPASDLSTLSVAPAESADVTGIPDESSFASVLVYWPYTVYLYWLIFVINAVLN